ncbi:RNA polymerase sigma factor [Desulfoscipio gibsoniae]|uniref:DNA-directed RNA polymerase specialized sigma subunit, sigma24 n=1 Tax=Desulfoscipio gibsoniae DSM 7213 TaxID=767817 RepID=R4KKX8_9FIRM|nr:sigma-70 family RNA polymerase sigma factor [Desulfoscipio gibsoniae]AGL03314.1 DNA-directed RNA polymerase specialized sigma subunit, sigma24 [Desulfoscipio gibsoniae DSM 7213]
MIKDLIVQSQTSDSSATLTLIRKFDPLLRKYAYKLYYDDAYNDLLFDFIEFLNNIRIDRMRDTSEGILISYICTSIRSNYIKRLLAMKRLQNFVPYSALSDSELYYAEAASATTDPYLKLELTGIDHVLTESELFIVKMIYLLGYTVTETAGIYRISRQAVNQTKRRALQKLKKWFEKKLA